VYRRDVELGDSKVYVIRPTLLCHQGHQALEVNAICCRTSVYPLDIEINRRIGVGLFKPVYWSPPPEAAVSRERRIDTGDGCTPPDGSLSWAWRRDQRLLQHHGNARTSVFAGIAAARGEVGGTIVQRATVVNARRAANHG
jgi:hypothetical protein